MSTIVSTGNDVLTESILTHFKQVKSPSITYGVIIDGEWGSGKTHYCRKELIPELESNSYKVSYISLFGLKNNGEFKDALISTIFKVNEPLSKTKDLIRKASKSVRQLEIVSAAIEAFNFTIEKLDLQGRIFILDDFERLSKHYTIEEFLGLLSYLVEQKQANIILVYNNKEIPKEFKEDYERMKEKIFSHTFSLKGEIHVDITSIIPNGLKHYAEQFNNALRTVVRNSKINNYRYWLRAEKLLTTIFSEFKIRSQEELQASLDLVYFSVAFLFETIRNSKPENQVQILSKSLFDYVPNRKVQIAADIDKSSFNFYFNTKYYLNNERMYYLVNESIVNNILYGSKIDTLQIGEQIEISANVNYSDFEYKTSDHYKALEEFPKALWLEIILKDTELKNSLNFIKNDLFDNKYKIYEFNKIHEILSYGLDYGLIDFVDYNKSKEYILFCINNTIDDDTIISCIKLNPIGSREENEIYRAIVERFDAINAKKIENILESSLMDQIRFNKDEFTKKLLLISEPKIQKTKEYIMKAFQKLNNDNDIVLFKEWLFENKDSIVYKYTINVIAISNIKENDEFSFAKKRLVEEFISH